MNRPFNLNSVTNSNANVDTKDKDNEKTSRFIYLITEIVTILLIVFGIALTLVMLPVIPFLWVSYKGFHGKYGIIKLIRENYNIYQL